MPLRARLKMKIEKDEVNEAAEVLLPALESPGWIPDRGAAPPSKKKFAAAITLSGAQEGVTGRVFLI